MSCPFHLMSTVLILCVCVCVCLGRPVNYVLVWLSVVGPLVGLDVPLKYSTQLHLPGWCFSTSDDCARVGRRSKVNKYWCCPLCHPDFRGWNEWTIFAFLIYSWKQYFFNSRVLFFFHIYYFVLAQTIVYFKNKIIPKCEKFSIFIYNKYESLFLCSFKYRKKSFLSV